MPDVIWDALWNGEANTTDPVIPAADWANNDRAHQFNGGANETYGGDTIDVDQDYLDVSLTPPGPVNPGSPRWPTSGGTVADFVIRNGNLNTFYQTSPGGGFAGPKKLTSAGNLTGTPVAVQAADGLISSTPDHQAGGHGAAASLPSAARSRPPTSAATSPATWPRSPPSAARSPCTRSAPTLTCTPTTRPARAAGFAGPKRLTSTGGLTGTPGGRAGRQRHHLRLRQDHRRRREGRLAERHRRRGDQERNLGGHLAGSPAAIVTGVDTIAVYAVGTHGQLYGFQQRGPVPGSPARRS